MRGRICAGALFAVAMLVPPGSAFAQTWGGTGSTSNTTDYNADTNWSGGGPAPTGSGQAAVFDATGSQSVVVTSGPIFPDSWTFNTNSKSFSLSGADVSFSAGGIVNNANAGQTITISNNMFAPVGQVQQSGASTLILAGTNSYFGDTMISVGTLVAAHATGTDIDALGFFASTVRMTGGTLQFGVGGSLANAISVDSGTATITAGSQTVSLTGAISIGAGATPTFGVAGDTGTLKIGGAGGTADPTAAIVIAGGTVKDNGNAGITSLTFSAASTTVNAGATLDFNDSNNQAIRNLKGDGNVVTGTVGGTTLSLFVDGNTSNTFGGSIGGPGRVLLATSNFDPLPSTMILTGSNTWTGGTEICDCMTLQLGNGGATGSIVGDIAIGGTLAVNRSGTLTLDGTLSDDGPFQGKLVQMGPGTLVLTGPNTYSGGTFVNAGTLSITNGSAIGTGDLALAQGTTFQLDGSFTLTNNISIAGDPIFDVTSGNTANISGTISDASLPAPLGVVEKIGAGMLVLSGPNTYSGGTVITAGILQVTNTASVGTGAVTLDGGTFQADGFSNLTFTNDFKINTSGGAVDNNGTLLEFSGTISNGNGTSGVLQITDSSGGFGATLLSGSNTFSGGVKVVGTTLQVSNDNAVGTGLVTLENGLFMAANNVPAGSLTFANNFAINNTVAGSAIDVNGYSVTITGNIGDGNGPGKLTVLDTYGGGVLVLLGTNTYSGGTFICTCGTLQLGDATHMASLVGAVVNEGYFSLINANTTGITSLANQFGGITVFGSFGGTETVSASSMTIDNNNGGTIFVAKSDAGTATITNRNGGGTIFLDQASAASATIINNHGTGTSFGTPFGTDTPTAGDATIVNNDGGGTLFNAFSTAGNATVMTNSGGFTSFFDNATGGTARFITNGTGFVDFSGSLGPTGDGRITAGSIEGSGFYYIGAGNTLVTGGNNLSTIVSGVIADSNPCGCAPGIGNLEKVGTGTMVLSGTNTYTGTTTVNGGILQVDGSIALSSLTTVNANAALTGIGTVGNTIIASGGTFAPGSSTPGTFMTVSGNLAFQSGALYLVVLDPSASTLAKVTGTATLNGAAGAAFLSGNYVQKRYTILNATGGVAGTFSSFDTLGKPNTIKTSLSYDANNVYLDLEILFAVPGGLNVNQQNVGNTLTNFFNTTGGIPLVFAQLTPGQLTQASGELGTGSQQATFNAMNLFLGLLTDPFVAGRGDGFGGGAGATPFADENASAYAASGRLGSTSASARDAFAAINRKAPPLIEDFTQRWSVWAAGYGGAQTTEGNNALGSNGSAARAYGTAVGVDYRVSPSTLAGFALAGGGTSFSVNGLGSGRSDLFQAGAFVRHNFGPAYLSAALAYGWQDVTTDRTVTIAGTDHLRAEFDANSFSGRFEGGYRYATPWMGFTPYAAAQFTTYNLPNYAEAVVAGNNTFALSYAAKSVTDTRSELGLRTDKSFAMQDSILTLRGRAAWAHDFNPDRAIAAVFQTLPGTAFVVNGAAQASNSALVTGAVEMKWRNGFSLAATFEGEFSNVTKSYAGKGVARYSW